MGAADVVADALGLSAQIAVFVVLAAVAGAVVTAILRVATRIDDEVLTLAGKLCGLGLLVYLSGSYFSTQVLDFTTQVWSTPIFYH